MWRGIRRWKPGPTFSGCETSRLAVTSELIYHVEWLFGSALTVQLCQWVDWRFFGKFRHTYPVVGGQWDFSLASLLKFCIAAANVNSSLAPLIPRNRKRSTFKIRSR